MLRLKPFDNNATFLRNTAPLHYNFKPISPTHTEPDTRASSIGTSVIANKSQLQPLWLAVFR